MMEFTNIMCFFFGFLLSGITAYISFRLGFSNGFYQGIDYHAKIMYDRLKKIDEAQLKIFEETQEK